LGNSKAHGYIGTEIHTLLVPATKVAFEADILVRNISYHMKRTLILTCPTTDTNLFINDFGSGLLIDVYRLHRTNRYALSLLALTARFNPILSGKCIFGYMNTCQLEITFPIMKQRTSQFATTTTTTGSRVGCYVHSYSFSPALSEISVSVIIIYVKRWK
jgi:hypothetical protein